MEEEAQALAHAMSPHLTDRKGLGTGREGHRYTAYADG